MPSSWLCAQSSGHRSPNLQVPACPEQDLGLCFQTSDTQEVAESLQGSRPQHGEGRRGGFRGTEQEWEGQTGRRSRLQLQSSARQRVKQLKCECKPTPMEGSVPPRTEGLAWSGCAALRCQEAVPRRTHGGSLVQPQHVQKEGADGGTTGTNVCQDNNHPTQPGAAPEQECRGKLQRGMKGPHLPLVHVAPVVPSPLDQVLLMASERATAQPGSPWVNKTCCFSAAESSGKGWDVPGRGLWAAHPPAPRPPAASPPRTQQQSGVCRLLTLNFV